MSDKSHPSTTMISTLINEQAEHSRRLDRLEAEVFPPPGGPTQSLGGSAQFQLAQQQLDVLEEKVKHLQKEINHVSTLFVTMESMDREIAELREQIKQLGKRSQLKMEAY